MFLKNIRTHLSRTWACPQRGNENLLGFTLVELIVVITILIILGTIAFVSLSGFSGSARDSSRVSDLSLISKGLTVTLARNGTYPDPTAWTGITYSGGTVWKQGAMGDSVISQISGFWVRMSKKPVDPLSSTEYVYSITTESKEYSLKADYEGGKVGWNTPSSVYADTGNPTIAYIAGNYNGIATKVTVGSPKTVYLLSVPNIVTTSSYTGVTVWSPQNFIVNGQNNTGGISFTPKIIYQSGALPSNDTEKVLFASGVISAYSGTSLSYTPNVSQFITNASNTGTLATVWGGVVNMVWGGGNVGGATTTNSGPSVTCTGTNVTQTDLGGWHGKCIFAYAGVDQSITVTGSVTFSVKLWGAGGGWSGQGTPYDDYGGAGGFASGSILVTTSEQLTVMVGQWGFMTTGVRAATYGGGGMAGDGLWGNGYMLASWWGLSGIFRGTPSRLNALAIAGGGGGAGNSTSNGWSGGEGGGMNGWGTSSASGGTQAGGGLGWLGQQNNTSSCFSLSTSINYGTGLAGGSGIANGDNCSGGGGGGGYYGGGGGGWNSGAGAGAGGAWYLGTMTSAWFLVSVNHYTAPNQGDSDYVAGVGNGGTASQTNAAGGNGLIVISW